MYIDDEEGVYVLYITTTSCHWEVMTNALLGTASMIDDSHEDFNVSADCLDAMQRLCHGTLEGELCNASWNKLLCSNAYWDDSEMLICFLYELIERSERAPKPRHFFNKSPAPPYFAAFFFFI